MDQSELLHPNNENKDDKRTKINNIKLQDLYQYELSEPIFDPELCEGGFCEDYRTGDMLGNQPRYDLLLIKNMLYHFLACLLYTNISVRLLNLFESNWIYLVISIFIMLICFYALTYGY